MSCITIELRTCVTCLQLDKASTIQKAFLFLGV
jgi:hypothetical protein